MNSQKQEINEEFELIINEYIENVIDKEMIDIMNDIDNGKFRLLEINDLYEKINRVKSKFNLEFETEMNYHIIESIKKSSNNEIMKIDEFFKFLKNKFQEDEEQNYKYYFSMLKFNILINNKTNYIKFLEETNKKIKVSVLSKLDNIF
jgi:tetrahydrodipicolinate N-succinyltransferase